MLSIGELGTCTPRDARNHIRIGYYLGGLVESRAPNLRHLTSEMGAGPAVGTRDLLLCLPLVFSRTSTKDDRFESAVGSLH